jgi:hypothetical protein
LPWGFLTVSVAFNTSIFDVLFIQSFLKISRE